MKSYREALLVIENSMIQYKNMKYIRTLKANIKRGGASVSLVVIVILLFFVIFVVIFGGRI
jgi:hypothetical protein